MRRMSKDLVDYYKKNYPRGTRVQLDSMGDDPFPVEPGTKGTVISVDSLGTLHCEFDNGRCLGICPEVDSFHKISEQKEAQSSEPKMSM